MPATPISTAVLVRALALALEEQDALSSQTMQRLLVAMNTLTQKSDTREALTLKVNVQTLLRQSNHLNTAAKRLEDACFGKTPEIDKENPWSMILPDLRRQLEGLLEHIALEGAHSLLEEAREDPTLGAEILKAGASGTAVFLLTGSFPKKRLSCDGDYLMTH
jgi:hypothetical protein